MVASECKDALWLDVATSIEAAPADPSWLDGVQHRFTDTCDAPPPPPPSTHVFFASVLFPAVARVESDAAEDGGARRVAHKPVRRKSPKATAASRKRQRVRSVNQRKREKVQRQAKERLHLELRDLCIQKEHELRERLVLIVHDVGSVFDVSDQLALEMLPEEVRAIAARADTAKAAYAQFTGKKQFLGKLNEMPAWLPLRVARKP